MATESSAVLIIDDEENLRQLLARIIELEGYHVYQASSIKAGLDILAREEVLVAISDVRLPDGSGLDLVKRLKTMYPALEVIVLTAFGSIPDGVNAIKAGAFDYVTKGEHQDKIIPLLSKALEKARLQQKIIHLEQRLEKRFGFPSIIGSDPKLLESIELAKKVAATDANVLLLGETGTGKEVFAEAIHYASQRKSKPFVALNCSAFSRDLLESELFGHAAGAFTGATHATRGYMEEANGGTLFLDEIAELNIDLQAKLLRAIESGEFYRVGESKARHSDFRLIAATNRDIARESVDDQFRKDLYYRLSVFTIVLSPLRERTGDIEPLARYFIAQFARKTNKKEPALTPPFLEALQQHAWKGNIRELKNVIERSVILADGDLTETALPPDFIIDRNPDALDLATVEKNHVLRVLAYTHGNKTRAAKLLGIGLTTLYQKLKDYRISSEGD